MGFATGAPSDPLFVSTALRARVAPPGVAGKAIRSSGLTAGESTGIFIIAGESLAANATAALYTPTNASKVDNVDVLDGTIYAAVDPLAGTSGAGGHWGGRLADKLIAAGKYQRVILLPIGVSSSAIADWRPGGALYPLALAAFARLSNMGMSPTAMLWQLGANDNAAGTTQAAYEAGLDALISEVVSLGFSAPWLIAKSTLYNNAVSAAIQAAIAGVVNGTNILAGADTDTLTGGTNRADGTHFTATGADASATLWRDQIVASL